MYAEYQWIDNKATKYKTDVIDVKKKDTSPLFGYKRTHTLKVDNYVVDNLSETTCLIQVYGKLTKENMEGLIRDYSERPETAQLLGTTSEFKSDAFYDAALNKSGKQDVLQIDEKDEASEEDDAETAKAKEAERKKLEKLKKELEKLEKDNSKIEKDIKNIAQDKGRTSGCCTIF